MTVLWNRGWKHWTQVLHQRHMRVRDSGTEKSREGLPGGQLRLWKGCVGDAVWGWSYVEGGTVNAHHTESRWLGLHLLCAPHGLIHQVLGYVHWFHTSVSSQCGLGLEAVLMRGQLYSSLLDELEGPGLPTKQGSSKPGTVARGLGGPRCTAICSGPWRCVGTCHLLPTWRVA